MRVVLVDNPFGIFLKTIRKSILLKIELHGYCTGGVIYNELYNGFLFSVFHRFLFSVSNGIKIKQFSLSA